MDLIKDVKIIECKKSEYVKPFSVQYKQNGITKRWDLVKTHDSVACVVYNKTSDKLLFVSQFRPAVYINKVKELLATEKKDQEDTDDEVPVKKTKKNTEDNITGVDTTKYPGSLGLTLELCAGITDKDKSLIETMKEELEEEVGYDVPIDKIEKITSYHSGVGTQGSRQTLYYAAVDDSMKVSDGGGCETEGEMIQVVPFSPDEAKKMLMDEAVVRTPSLIYAVTWFFLNKFSKL